MSILELIKKKREIADRIPQEKRIKDEHSRRPPIKCGLTIHPGYGCSLGCLYCYVYDMGLGNPVPSKLDGESFLYSLTTNPYFLPEKTFLAIGSITEPFLPKIANKTVEFAKQILKLKNPVQLSTKMPGSGGKEFLEILPKASFLVSISDSTGILEEKAPSPKERIEIASSLYESGYNVYLFLRPIIPGITERDEKLIELIGRSEIKGVVLGGLRVTERTLKLLETRGVAREIYKRIEKRPTGKEQVPVKVADLKEALRKKLEEIGVRTFPLACAAMADSYSLGCRLCKNRCKGKMEKVNKGEIVEFLETLGKEVDLKVNSNKIIIFGKIGKIAKELLKAYYRLPIVEKLSNLGE